MTWYRLEHACIMGSPCKQKFATLCPPLMHLLPGPVLRVKYLVLKSFLHRIYVGKIFIHLFVPQVNNISRKVMLCLIIIIYNPDQFVSFPLFKYLGYLL